MERLRVLVVEDHLGERINIMRTLGQFSLEVETAVTFQRAKELISKRKYSLVVCEHQLVHCPDVQGDGSEVWTLFHSLNPDGQFVLLSPSAPELTLEYMKNHIAAPIVLNKPLHTTQLQGVVSQRVFGRAQVKATQAA